MQLDKCMNMDSKKQLYIISGCNGAGKTTASYTVLPDVLECKEFVNADEIARGLSPFNPESMAIEAGRLMLQRINELLRNQQNFSIETTLATRTYTRLKIGEETLNVLAITATDIDSAKERLATTCIEICKEINATTHLAVWRRYLQTVWLHQ